MKRLALALLLVAASIFPAAAQEYYDIDVDLPTYPEMEPIPDSPVYYAPQVDSNYFFYDGLYWDFYNDGWYSSTWYNGPWVLMDPIFVPTYLLWVPVRYYRRPPHYFRGWHHDRPPRWGQHWGRDWQNRHNAVFGGGRAASVRAPLPDYQRRFTRDNYPRGAQQSVLHGQQYSYQPQEGAVRQHYQSRIAAQPQRAAVPDARREEVRRDDAPRVDVRSNDRPREEIRSLESRPSGAPKSAPAAAGR